MVMKIGVARAVINPPLTQPHGGWGAQSHVLAEGWESDLWVTVLLMTDGSETAVLVDLDLCFLSVEMAEEIRNRIGEVLGLKKSSIRTSTTHTHAAPLLHQKYFQSSQRAVNAYRDYLMEQTAGAALQAGANLTEVTVGAGYGRCFMGISRRQMLEDGRMIVGVNAEGETDPTVGAVRFDNLKGETVATIVHYSCHPTVLGPANKQFSPDYPGAVKRLVEEIVGGKCLFLQGCTGNIGPGPEGFKDSIEAKERLGRILGCEAARVLLETETTVVTREFEGVVESGATLGYWNVTRGGSKEEGIKVLTRDIKLPLKEQLPPEEFRRNAAEYEKELDELRRNGGSEEEIKAVTFKTKRAFMALNRSERFYGKKETSLEAHFISVGDLVFIGLPGEPFSQIGAAVRRRSPFAWTLVSGYSNGSSGYIPTAADYPLGGYEVETTPFAAETAGILIDAVVRVLEELKAGSQK